MTNSFLSPKSIAVIGASTDPKKLGYLIVKNIKDSKYTGRVYPINNKIIEDTNILNYKVYNSLGQIHEVPELVIISIPSLLVFDELMKAYSQGCKNFVIITAGFKEINNTKDEDLINQFIKKFPDANVLGPNCLGFIDTSVPLNASFSASFPKAGKLGFYSQSGALCTAVLDWSDKLGMGFSKFISLGNKNQISENTFLDNQYLKNSPAFFYLESFNDGIEFVKKANKIQSPLIVLHPGRYSETSSAMASHTGSIASSDNVIQEALSEAGVIRATGLEDIMDLMMIFNFYNEYKEINNIAIVSNAGGPGIITTDFIKDYGMNLANLEEITKKSLSEKLPRTANIHNPIDLVGDAMADRYGYALDIVLGDPNVDAVIVLLTPQAMTQIDLTAEYIQRLSKTHGKVVVASFMGGKRVDRYEQYLFSYGVPYFDYPERAVWALNKLRLLKKNTLNEIKVKEINDNLENAQEEIKKIFNPIEEKTITNIEDLKSFRTGENIALKLISPSMWHKTDSGGVLLKLDTDKKREDAFNKINELAANQKIANPEFQFSIQAQQMINIEHELLIGAKRDINFGNVVAFGLGGIYANIIDENMLFLEFASKEYIIEKITNSKTGQIISGARGLQGIDLSKVADAILKIHEIFKSYKSLNELDINPVAIMNGELYAIDIKTK